MPAPPDFRDQVRAVLSTAGSASGHKRWSQIKHSNSLNSSMPTWRDGQLHVAEDNRGRFVLVIENKVGGAKMVPLDSIKSKKLTPTNPGRCMIALKDGSMVHIHQAFPPALQSLCDTIDSVGKQTNISSKFGQKTSPTARTISPYKRAVVSSAPRDLAPKRTSPTDAGSFTSMKSRTPSSHKQHSPWRPSSKRKTPDDDGTFDIDDSDSDNLGVSMLFTDQMDKENVYTPSRPKKERQGVLQMREKGGGSIFMESFEEKQKEREDNRRKGPTPSVALSGSFYNKNKQMAGYGGSDLFSRTTSTPRIPTQPETTLKKRTLGFLDTTGSNKKKTNWRPWSQTSHTPSARSNLQGFSNLGNTCYMNAILQSLLGLQCFIQDLQNVELMRAVPKSSLYKALSSLLYAKQTQKGSLEVGCRLQRVKEAISATATRFSGFMQHDAHEFLCQCLDQLKEDVEKVNKPKKEKNVPQEVKDSISPPSQVVPSVQQGDKPAHVCAVSQNFEMEVVHSILCQGCGEEVTKKETFNDLSLDLPRTRGPFSLQTALDSFFASEKLDYACAKCDCKEALVSHKFTKLPRVLVLHLKRYSYSEALANSKLRLSVGIPCYLTLAWHTTSETKPPPVRTGGVPTPHVPLSPLRDNMRTPTSKMNNPLHVGGSGGFRKQLYSEPASKDGFKFKRIRTLSGSPRKEVSRFISRFDDYTPQKTVKSKEEKWREMDEEKQLAFVLELSRKEAEAASGQKVKGHSEEPTDEQLLQALDGSVAGKERTDQKQTEEGALMIGSDSDDELPPGLTDDTEDADLKQALEMSKKSMQYEYLKQGAPQLSGDIAPRPVVNVGLLGGARKDAFLGATELPWKRLMERSSDTDDRANVVQDAQMDDAGDAFAVRTHKGLLGGAKKQSHGGLTSGSEEPMDTEDDQPLAFCLDDGQVDDPTQPKMWDAESGSGHGISKKENGRRSGGDIRTYLQDVSEEGSPKDTRAVDDDAPQESHTSDSGQSSGSSAYHVAQEHHSASEDHVEQTSGHPQVVGQMDSGVKMTVSPSSDSDEESLWQRNKKSGDLTEPCGTPTNKSSFGDTLDDPALWKKNKNCKKNILREFSPLKTTVPPSEDEGAGDEDPEPTEKEELKRVDDTEKEGHKSVDDTEGRATRDEGGSDTKEEGEVMTYEEMKAREDEDIRKATELSMREAKEIEEKEAAEILRAQEMSLQELQEASGMTPMKEEEEEPAKLSPIYSQEEAEMLSKNSEEGHLSNAYRLLSIVSHIGSSSLTGHYVSDVYDPVKRSWLSYDDSTVMKRDERALREERQRTGYIFFYQAKELL